MAARLGDVSTLEAGHERVNPFESARARRIHGLFLALLWEHVRRVDRRDILLRLEEPELGDPVVATYRGRRISQDLGNSVYELYSATAALPGNEPGPGGVLELGGGYGRVAWVFLEEFPRARYVLVDIPPALAIAQEYLTTLFPRAGARSASATSTTRPRSPASSPRRRSRSSRRTSSRCWTRSACRCS